MLSNIQLSRERNISVALFPMPNYQDISPCAASDCPKPEDTWWANSPHDYIWWESWFEHVTTFLNHHADLAEVTGAKALVIGGEWLSPALPGGVPGSAAGPVGLAGLIARPAARALTLSDLMQNRLASEASQSGLSRLLENPELQQLLYRGAPVMAAQ